MMIVMSVEGSNIAIPDHVWPAQLEKYICTKVQFFSFFYDYKMWQNAA